MKFFLILLLITLTLSATQTVNPIQNHIYKVGESLLDFKLKSQYAKTYELSDQTFYIFITYDRLSTKLQNTFVLQRPYFLEYTQSLLIVDISVIPRTIFTLFVNPKMKRIPLPLLYSDEISFSKMFPYKEGHISIIKIKHKVIEKIVFANNEDVLKDFFQVK